MATKTVNVPGYGDFVLRVPGMRDAIKISAATNRLVEGEEIPELDMAYARALAAYDVLIVSTPDSFDIDALDVDQAVFVLLSLNDKPLK